MEGEGEEWLVSHFRRIRSCWVQRLLRTREGERATADSPPQCQRRSKSGQKQRRRSGHSGTGRAQEDMGSSGLG